MPFDPNGVATQMVNERLGGAGPEQGENEGPLYQDTLHDMWDELIDAIHARDPVRAAAAHQAVFDYHEAQPHDEYEDTPEEEEEYADGGPAGTAPEVMGAGRLASFPNNARFFGGTSSAPARGNPPSRAGGFAIPGRPVRR
jgi:hypothetical protein